MSRLTAATSRADLLRAIGALSPEDPARHRIARLLGYAPEVERTIPSGTSVLDARLSVTFDSVTLVATAETEAPLPAREPLRERYFAIMRCEPVNQPLEAEPGDQTELLPLTRADCRPRKSVAAPTEPLVRRAQLWPALRQSLGRMHPGALDFNKLTQRIANGDIVRRLPQRTARHWAGTLDVIWDSSHRLLPYDEDFRALLDEVRRRRGCAGLRVWQVDETPDSPIAFQVGDPSRPWRRARGPIPIRGAGAQVLILSDLGALAPETKQAEAWTTLAARIAASGGVALAWVPMSARLIPAEFLQYGQAYCLDRTSRLRPVGRAASANPLIQREYMEALRESLLKRMALCIRVEPALLRALRLITPDTAAEPGLEGLVWAHDPVVLAGHQVCVIGTDSYATYRRAFAGLPLGERIETLRRIQKIHGYRGRSTEIIETRLWAVHGGTKAWPADLEVSAEDAESWFKRLARCIESDRSILDLTDFVRDIYTRNRRDEKWLAYDSVAWATLWAGLQEDDIPLGLHEDDVASAMRRRHQSADLQMWHLAQRGCQLVLQRNPSTQSRGSTISSVGGVQWVRDPGCRVWLSPDSEAAPLVDISEDQFTDGELVTHALRFQIAAIERPQWAREIGRDRFGLYADLEFKGITQRLRWIEPGEFLMGSPDSEQGRDSDEGPQHKVRLMQGYWLADTACTQALWQAVMGSNPSRFADDPENPVENVSWDDAQEFLKKLQAQLPGCMADLPTEAEWEYACRAGTQSAYSFGDRFDPKLANCYESELKRTQRVKTYDSNAWGLYQMHGNVWEWCADGQRYYRAEPQVDPRGPEGPEAGRVARGGSWISYARGARSAYRDRRQRVHRDHFQGFRFLLRSMVSQEQEAPEGLAGKTRRDAGSLAFDGGGPARDAPDSRGKAGAGKKGKKP